MTALLEVPAADASGGLAHALAVIRHRTGLDVLLDAGNGEVLDHAVTGSAPAAVVRAVLTKDLSALQATAHTPRTVAVVPAGPVIAWQLGPALEGVAVPICATSPACVWLLGNGVQLEDGTAEAVADLVAAGLPDLQRTGDLEAVLSGRAALPPSWEGQPLTVAVVRTTSPRSALAALRSAARGRDLPGLVGVVDGSVVALVVGPDPEWSQAAGRELARLDGSARGAFCRVPAGGSALPQLHAVASAAASVSSGVMENASALASRVAVDHASRALVAAPVEPDVVAALLDSDAERGTELARTLLTWLELHGDVAAAAAHLTVHVNTLRYRVRRAADLIDGDLADPDVRLDVHLRLRRAVRAEADSPCE